eukprot:TRINITY_DN2393_c0_g1_i1.p1 TRINITY_DN2393_c0_g1~~TRINITY_DN2393_c0_g1_i1.p1  ORF type:complete len:425 (-),score=103.16 TRINITY_DN2393_c0_g1_i1:5-1279(-)
MGSNKHPEVRCKQDCNETFPLAHILTYLMGMAAQIISLAFLTILVFCAMIKNYDLQNMWWRIDKWLVVFYETIKSSIGNPDEEEIVMNERYYAERYGYRFEEHDVVTKDGHILRMHRVFKAGSDMKPLILQHGLFQCSGIFMMNEKDSLAFYLAERGFDVWCGNNRGIFEGHTHLDTNDDEYWDWSIDELGKYDFPAFLQYVRNFRCVDKVSYIGHSQGNAQAFLGLHHDPELASKLNLFVAIAPAFHIVAPKNWALQLMPTMTRDIFFTLFGKKSFVPIMYLLQKKLPAAMFGFLGYNMFKYLFNWNDSFWAPNRKNKYFLHTPRPTSCKVLQHWSDAMKLGGVHPYMENKICNVDIRCPIALFYSTDDSLVHGDGLVNDLRQKNVNLIHAERMQDYEHMDLVWAKDSGEKVFSKLVDVLNKV